MTSAGQISNRGPMGATPLLRVILRIAKARERLRWVVYSRG
jgi:hypothetical protein